MRWRCDTEELLLLVSGASIADSRKVIKPQFCHRKRKQLKLKSRSYLISWKMTQFTSMPLKPKSGTATMSILGKRKWTPKYFSKNGSAAAVSWYAKLWKTKSLNHCATKSRISGNLTSSCSRILGERTSWYEAVIYRSNLTLLRASSRICGRRQDTLTSWALSWSSHERSHRERVWRGVNQKIINNSLNFKGLTLTYSVDSTGMLFR